MSGIKTQRAKLDALLALLNSAAQEAIAEYERAGDVPSTESAHPLDSQLPSLALKNAVRILEGACEQLCTTLAPPAHTLLTVSFIPYRRANRSTLALFHALITYIFSAEPCTTRLLAWVLPSKQRSQTYSLIILQDCRS